MKDPKDFSDIQEIREIIDQIDFNILKLFGDRNRCVEEIVNFKTSKAGIIANKRQKELIAVRREWAKTFNLDPDLYEKIFKMLIKSNIKKELIIFAQKESNIAELTKIHRENVQRKH